MELRRPHILYILICLWLLVSPSNVSSVWAKDFVVVIDAGHGGHDPGAIGKISKEKNINLKVALKLGNLIKQNCNDVKVVYTRSKMYLYHLTAVQRLPTMQKPTCLFQSTPTLWPITGPQKVLPHGH